MIIYAWTSGCGRGIPPPRIITFSEIYGAKTGVYMPNKVKGEAFPIIYADWVNGGSF